MDFRYKCFGGAWILTYLFFQITGIKDNFFWIVTFITFFMLLVYFWPIKTSRPGNTSPAKMIPVKPVHTQSVSPGINQENIFICPFCKKTFHRKQDLKTHNTNMLRRKKHK